jgi:hypothetical protein
LANGGLQRAKKLSIEFVVQTIAFDDDECSVSGESMGR